MVIIKNKKKKEEKKSEGRGVDEAVKKLESLYAVGGTVI